MQMFGLISKDNPTENLEQISETDDISISENEILPFGKRDDFLSLSELSFYKVLKQAVAERGVICPKVSLSDVLFVKQGSRSDRQVYFNKISRKHVDYIVCDEKMQILFGVELDDSTHNRADRVERDKFLEKAFDAAQIPLIRIKNKNFYTLSEVKEKVDLYLVDNSSKEIESKAAEPVNEEKNHENNEVPLCPKCGVTMALREAKSGENKGNKFYGCVNYPKCREIVNVNSN